MKKVTNHPLFPLPKVYVPFFASLVTFGEEVIRTGVVNRVSLAVVFSGAAWSIIGYATPLGTDAVERIAKKVANRS